MRKILDKLLKCSILTKQYVMEQNAIATVSILRQSLASLKDDVRVLEMKVASLRREAKPMPDVTHTPDIDLLNHGPWWYQGIRSGPPIGTYCPPTDPPYIPRDLTEAGFPEI